MGKAVKLADHHERSRLRDVTMEVAGRLNTLKRYEGAGDLYRIWTCSGNQ